jgi:multiple sugar transport system ATP-binding protein
MSRVVLDNLTKAYTGGVLAVNNVSLEVADGEFVCLVGPSGCGKTTALRMISGLEEISSGEVRIGDKVVNDLPARERDLALVFQSYALYPHMTVFQNISFGLEIRKVPKRQRAEMVHEAARILDLEPYLDRKPGQLSGGQRQRVALGRAIVRQPAAFLMDEPLSNLDAKLRVQTRAEIARLHQRLGSTMIYVTHDQIEAMTMADRIAVLRSGVLEQIGSPRELYEQPQNRFVAGFIGSPAMNFLELAMQIAGDKVSLTGGAVNVSLSDEQAARLAATGLERVVVGVRPEHLRLRRDSDRGMHVSTTVEVAEFLGNGSLLHATADGVDLVAVIEQAKHVSVGDQVSLYSPPGDLHFFAVDSGEVLATDGNGSAARA